MKERMGPVVRRMWPPPPKVLKFSNLGKDPFGRACHKYIASCGNHGNIGLGPQKRRKKDHWCAGSDFYEYLLASNHWDWWCVNISAD